MTISASEVRDSFENSTTISLAVLREWISSDDIDTAGAALAYLTDAKYFTKIQPSVSRELFFVLMRTVVERAIVLDPKSEWAPSRYEAAYSMTNWIKSEWASMSDVIRNDIRQWIESLYRRSNPDIQQSLETGLLEHLFENKDIQTYFANWSLDPEWKDVFSRSTDWSPNM